MPILPINLPQEQIAHFCKRWKIAELALFGSVLRDDFSPESDIDLLVTFAPEAMHSLLDLVQMEDEMTQLLGHKVDLVESQGLKNPYRRHAILRTKEVIYAA
jgi:predicted nucleotidyltransferase